METTIDILRGEIERLFTVEEIHAVCRDLLDIDPAEFGGTTAKGTLARQLVDRCLKHDALEALTDVLVAQKPDADVRVRDVYTARLATDLPVGSTLGEWKLIKKIGEGGGGVVYLAEKAGGGRAAVKVIREDYSRDKRAVQRYLAAMRLVRKVEHPALVAVQAVGVAPNGRPYVVMEHVDGSSLAARVARTGPMHYSEARPIVKALLEGLGALHQAGLVHGDVKVENVLLERKADTTRVVLCDFGTDRLSPRRTAENGATGPMAVFGTPKALAPEQLRGGAPDPRTDLYGVGVLLYEILTGKPPFGGASPADVLVEQLTREPEPASRLAPKGWVVREIDALLAKALAKNPTGRPASTTAFLEEFEACGRAMAAGKEEKKPTVSREDAEAAAQLLLGNPTDGTMAVELEKSAGGAGDWKIATEALAKAAEMVEAKDVKKDLLFRLARILDAEVQDAEGAEKVYRQVLELDPADEMAAVALEELKRGAGQHEQVIEMLLERHEQATDAKERANALREVARVYDGELKDVDKAFDAISMAFLEAPREEAVVKDLERIVGASKRWAQLVQTVSAAAQEPREGADAVALYTRLGRWYAVELGRPDFALPCYSQALVIEPGADAAYEGVCEIYRRSQSWAELAAALLRRADATPNPSRARGFLIEAASIFEDRLSDRKRAADLYRRILADDPAHPEAASALEQLYRKESDWGALTKLLEAKAKMLSGHEKAEVLAAAAEVYEDRLDNADEAMRRYESVLELDPQNLSALKGAERLYAKAGKFRELLPNLRAQLTLSATPRQKVGLLERIGAIHEEQFLEHEAAANAYSEALDIDPNYEACLRALARVYRSLGLHDEAVAVLERHVKIAEDPARKAELLTSLGRALMESGKRPDRAIEVYRSALELRPDDREILTAIAKLSEQLSDAKGAVAALEKSVSLMKEPKEKAEAYARMGRILGTSGDRDSAIARFKQALDLDPANSEAQAGLRASFADRGDYAGAISSIEKEIEASSGATQKSKLLAEMGNIYRDKVKDPRNAETSFKRALELDPTNVAAASPLAEILFEGERWDEAVKIYETWAPSASALSREQAIRLFGRLGIIYTKLGRSDDAVASFKKAREAAPEERGVLTDMAKAAFDHELWGEARALYAEYLSRYGKELDKSERGLVLYRLGETKRHAGELEGALGPLSEAAELEPNNAAVLRSKAAVHMALSQWDEAIRTKRLLMDVTSEQERHDLLVEVGQTLAEKLGDRQKAAKSFSAALEIVPNDRNVLSRLMQVYSDEKEWDKLVDVVLRIAQLVSDPRQLAKYHQTAAAICHRESGQLDQGLQYYDMALDNDPTMLKAFDGIVEILADRQDWAGLERAYRKMIFRLPKEGEVETKVRLWSSLAEIYHHRLQNVAEAVTAYETAQDLDPADRRRLETLVTLYESDLKRYGDRAVKAHGEILHGSPYRIDSYKALRKTYTQRKKPDEAWCLCAALTNLNMAEPDEQAFFEKHRAKGPAHALEKLSEEAWTRHMVHPDASPLITTIFGTVTPAVLKVRSKDHGSYGVDRKNKVDVAKDDNAVVKTIHYAAGVLGLTIPELFIRPTEPAGLTFGHTSPPCLFVGGGLLEGGDPQRAAFEAGRVLSYCRPGHYLRQLVPTGSGLRAWLLAAIKTVVPAFPVPGDLSQPIAEALDALKHHLDAPDRERLGSQVGKLVQSATEIDLKRWVAGIDYTADRAGFVLANDLEVVTAALRKVEDTSTGTPQKDRLRELILFAVGEPYFAVRQRLGIALRTAS